MIFFSGKPETINSIALIPCRIQERAGVLPLSPSKEIFMVQF